MNQPVTTNPIIIMMINMTVVFAVLWGLSLLVRLIHIVDPTRDHEAEQKALAQKKNAAIDETSIAAIPGTDIESAAKTDKETFILIAAAIAAYGYQPSQIVSIRPMTNKAWMQAGRMEAVQNRKSML
jgi:glutaconyl-CoA/methylmalonyl-CoA decarboxylase subunit delta